MNEGTEEETTGLTHLDERGAARMVDISGKPVTTRTATARGLVRLNEAAVAALRDDTLPKGDALAVVRVAAIQAAKHTADLIPLCHPLPLTGITVGLEIVDEGVRIEVGVRTTSRTGVEMEALTAVSVGALTVIDMTKAVDRHAAITDVRVVAKAGGRSGDWSAA